MLLHKKYFTIILLVILASCGFSPVYKENMQKEGKTLASVDIISPNNLMGQFFKTKLSDLLNPTSRSVPAQYKIEIGINKNELPLAIQQDRTITRYKVIVNVTYKLYRIENGEIIDQGTIKREGGYNKVESDYATYISEEDTTRRIVKELAEDTRIRIMSTILKI